MKIRIITLLLFFCVILNVVSAQRNNLPGKTEPIENTFTQDSILFHELLSKFTMRCKQYDTLMQPEWFNPLNDPDRVPLDAKYEKILMSVPFFKTYPAFRIDCQNGYLLGIFNHYSNQKSIVAYLDLLSYDLKGQIKSRMSLAKFNLATYIIYDEYTLQQYQLSSMVNILNGEIQYSYTRSTSTVQNVTHTQSSYRYKIQDDATLKLISVEHRQD